jgi:hypothetical protein
MTRGQGLTTIVLLHFAINIVHGSAHAGAQVRLSRAGALFVYTVILAAPLAGLALWRWRPVLGGWTVAASMFGALAFGLINHFILDGADHVSRVGAEWRQLFGATAVLLLVCEAAGTAAGIWAAAAIVPAHPGRPRATLTGREERSI